MLNIRLQRAQLELQAHRKWLHRFTTGPPLPTQHYTHNITRSTSGEDAQQANIQKALRGKPRSAWQKRQQQKHNRVHSVQIGALSLREELLEAIRLYDVKNVIRIYNALPEKKPLASDETRLLAQCVHQSLRSEIQKPKATQRREDADEIVAFAIQLIKDIRKGNILPSVRGHVHLLGVFKESGTLDAGIRFWQWLETQDEDYVNLDVYAVALELLAITGKPLQDMEEFYQNALARFPGTFSAYHLSPTAIVPDREQATIIKGLPMSLLQSMAFAQLLRGDSHKAYLALDIALRLYPATVSPRFLAQFQDERPASEYYTVFAMACRAGIQIPASHFKRLLAQLRLSSDHSSASTHISSIRAMLATVYLYLGSSGALSSNSVNEIIIALTQMLRIPGASNMEPEQRKQTVDSVLAAIRKAMEVFGRYEALPSASAFNSIITNVAGYGRARDVVRTVLADMDSLHVQPDGVTRRSILTAAGLNGDWKSALGAWESILSARQLEGKRPERLDIVVFARAAKRCGMETAARAEVDTLKTEATPEEYSTLEYHLSRQLENPIPKESTEIADAEEIVKAIDEFCQDLAFIEEHTRDGPTVQDFGNQHLPMTLLSGNPVAMLREQEMRKLYDEFTTEQTSTRRTLQAGENTGETSTAFAQSGAPVSPALSMTNIPFGTIRYENWKNINYLLWLAEKHDQEYERVVDQAIAKGVSPSKRDMGLTRAEIQSMAGFGLSEVANQESKTLLTDVEAARKEVMRLRFT